MYKDEPYNRFILTPFSRCRTQCYFSLNLGNPSEEMSDVGLRPEVKNRAAFDKLRVY